MKRTEHLVKMRNYIRYFLYIMVIVSPMFVVQIKEKQLFLWLQILFVVIMFISYRRFYIAKSIFIIGIFIEPFIAAIFATTSSMPDVYRRAAINFAIMSIPLYCVVCYLYKMIKSKIDVISVIIKALKVAIVVEVVWFFVQLLLYKIVGIDINQIIFVDTLHTVTNASFIRDWVWYPSGLSWHSVVLAPLFVMGMLLFDNIFFRIVIVLEAFLCGNSTTLLGVMLCIMLLMIRTIYNQKIEITTKKLVGIIIVVILVCIMASTPGYYG